MHGDVDGHLVSWVGPDPTRIDAAAVRFDGDKLLAHGASTTADWSATYRLRTGAEWVTEELDVRVDDSVGSRSLSLLRGDSGWSAVRSDEPNEGAATSRELRLPDLDDALDCDLGLCPLTNTMPILRAGLLAAAQAGEAREVRFTMAWVSVPELDVQRSEQIYLSESAVVGGGATIKFRAGDFVAHLEIDSHGLVVNYPSIGRRIAHWTT